MRIIDAALDLSSYFLTSQDPHPLKPHRLPRGAPPVEPTRKGSASQEGADKLVTSRLQTSQTECETLTPTI